LTVLTLGGSVIGAIAMLLVPIRFVSIGAIAFVLGEILLSPDQDHSSGSRAYRFWGILRIMSSTWE
jgi:uncharacterized metal-binding protein